VDLFWDLSRVGVSHLRTLALLACARRSRGRAQETIACARPSM
jgi:hypothetical protein